ncbi:Hint domain-containing protein [Cognatiyoonia sp. IB215446]|uniref:Hint domain-containing protein n=1 Tax=Cognatiyoonia sp. IB215446 TaxID=3097355 RepID=UPI002A0F7562|nr:Hint domain-containing protein [Cognatiyoonia sp. IB215446]MDX8349901.1 Hint domain-containing protein [Cognatiyoonia sp. IB215446]
MPFTDVIDDYTNGATGTLTTSDGQSVGYTVTANVNTISRPGTDLGAQVTGDGSETVTVDFDETIHGMTVSVNRSTPGEVYYLVVDGAQVDLNQAIADGTVEFTMSGAATQIITPDGGISSTGTSFDGSLASLHFQSPVNTITIFGAGGSSGNWDLFEIGIDSEDFRIVCFAADTLLDTPKGPIRIAEINAGDLVCTYDAGPCRVLQTSTRRFTPLQLLQETRLLPVRIKAGALGHGLPRSDLIVSRQHRILVASRIAARLLGTAEVLIPAIRLVGLPGIDIDRSMQPVTYHHILLQEHNVVLAHGAPAESLFLGPISVQTLDDALPEVTIDITATPSRMTPVRPFPDAKQCKKIIAAHRRHARALLEEITCIA